MYGQGPPPAAYLASVAAMKAAEPKPPPDPSKPGAPEAVNKTGGIETDDGRTLFGLDAEIYLKVRHSLAT